MGNEFAKLLEKTGVSTYEVAKATGLKQSTLSEWKSGRIKNLGPAKLLKLATYFGVPIETFIEKGE